MSKTSFKYEKADDSAGFLLWKITALWQQELAQVLSQFGITQTQYAILASLKWFEEHKENSTQAHLVEHTRIDKMTLSKAVRRLQQADLVVREASHKDSRATNVRFSAQGRKLVKKAIVAIENADEAFFACLSSAELVSYKGLTSKIIEKNGQQTEDSVEI